MNLTARALRDDSTTRFASEVSHVVVHLDVVYSLADAVEAATFVFPDAGC